MNQDTYYKYLIQFRYGPFKNGNENVKLINIDKQYLTKELLSMAMYSINNFQKYVPDNYKNKKLCIKFVRYGGKVDTIDDRFITEENLDKFINVNPECIYDIIDKVITQKKYLKYSGHILNLVMTKYPHYFGALPHQFINYSLIEKGLQKYPENVNNIPKNMLSNYFILKYMDYMSMYDIMTHGSLDNELLSKLCVKYPAELFHSLGSYGSYDEDGDFHPKFILSKSQGEIMLKNCEKCDVVDKAEIIKYSEKLSCDNLPKLSTEDYEKLEFIEDIDKWFDKHKNDDDRKILKFLEAVIDQIGFYNLYHVPVKYRTQKICLKIIGDRVEEESGKYFKHLATNYRFMSKINYKNYKYFNEKYFTDGLFNYLAKSEQKFDLLELFILKGRIVTEKMVKLAVRNYPSAVISIPKDMLANNHKKYYEFAKRGIFIE